MKQVYKSEIQIPFYMADPAGIVFFGHVYSLAHTEYEKWLTKEIENWDLWFKNPDWIAPIKKSNAEYFNPMRAGEKIEIAIYIKQMTDSSFTTFYEFKNNNTLCAQVEILQVFCDRKTIKKIPIPDLPKKILNK